MKHYGRKIRFSILKITGVVCSSSIPASKMTMSNSGQGLKYKLKDAFNNVKSYYAEDKLSLLARKGVYPYEYMDTPEKLKETQLPPKEAFYSRLNNEGISNENYAHAREVWETFEMKNLEDYHNLYNRVDVSLLTDVFENFRDICIKNYTLDPAHY